MFGGQVMATIQVPRRAAEAQTEETDMGSPTIVGEASTTVHATPAEVIAFVLDLRLLVDHEDAQLAADAS